MSSLYTKQRYNVYKTFLLMSIFFIIVVGISWGFSLYFQSQIILYVVVLIVVSLQIVSYWKSHEIVIKLTKARKITREEFFDYWNIVENLCIQLGVEMPALYVIDDPSPNAFATGRNPKHSAIVCTTGLLNIMDRSELEGVLAHELAHIQNRDTLLMTATVVMFSFVTIMLDILLHTFAFSDRSDVRSPLTIVIVLAAYILLPIVLMIIRLAISRRREYQADATAAIYTRYPEGLASALEKIEQTAVPMKKVDSSTAHLFISDPFGKKKKLAWASKLFDTHPPIQERISQLRSSQ